MAPTVETCAPQGRIERQLPGLDGLRMVAVSLVVIYHANHRDGFATGTWLSTIVENGWFGVAIFFVLSGFLITHLLIREEARAGGVGLRNYFLRRIIRIVPPAYFYIAIVTLLAAAGLITMPWSHLRPSLLFYVDYVGTGPVTGHYWTLSVEEQFYLIWPLAFVALRTNRSRLVVAAARCSRGTDLETPKHRVGRKPFQRELVPLRPEVRFAAYGLSAGDSDAMASGRRGPQLAVVEPRLICDRVRFALGVQPFPLHRMDPQDRPICPDDPTSVRGGCH